MELAWCFGVRIWIIVSHRKGWLACEQLTSGVYDSINNCHLSFWGRNSWTRWQSVFVESHGWYIFVTPIEKLFTFSSFCSENLSWLSGPWPQRSSYFLQNVFSTELFVLPLNCWLFQIMRSTYGCLIHVNGASKTQNTILRAVCTGVAVRDEC